MHSISFVLYHICTAALTVSPNPGELTVCEGTEVVLTCEVTYHGYKAPVLEWYSHQGGLLPCNISVDTADGRHLVCVLLLYSISGNMVHLLWYP